jgi:hypothetical protein
MGAGWNKKKKNGGALPHTAKPFTNIKITSPANSSLLKSYK